MREDEIPFPTAASRRAAESLDRLGAQPATLRAAAEAAVPLAPAMSRFVAPEAQILSAGTPSPRLVRGVLSLVRGVAAAAREAFGGKAPEPGRPGSVSALQADAAGAAEAEARRLLSATIANARSDRRALSGLGKFVDGAIVLPAGQADGAAPLATLTRWLAAAGIVSSFSLVLAPDAAAWDHGQHRTAPGTAQTYQVQRPIQNQFAAGPAVNPYAVQAWRERRAERRDERRAAMVATGAVIAGALLANQGGAGLGYGGYGAYPQPYAQPYPNGYGAYGNGYAPPYAPPAGYGVRPAPPSDAFTIGAKTLVAVQVGSVPRADAIINRAFADGVECLGRLGPGANCTIRTHGITLDPSRGEYIAVANGVPVMMERDGILQRFRPDILERAYAESRGIAAEEGLGRRPGMGY